MDLRFGLLCVVVASACAGSPGDRNGTPAGDGEHVALPPELGALLVPSDSALCHGEFPHPATPRGEADVEAFARAAWRNPDRGGIPTEPDADAWCYAPGPHRDVNLSVWCCRAAPSQP